MRILIDECLDWRLCRAMAGHDCVSIHQMSWGGVSNGELLQKAQNEFDVFLTGDMNLSLQQNLTKFDIAVIVLEARSTRLLDTSKLIPQVLEVLRIIKSGDVVRLRPAAQSK
jgi:predicted nuclease of predicted toxin-antitoxin system